MLISALLTASSLLAPPVDAGGPLPNPRWEVAFERKGDIWLSHADGSGLRRLARKAANPHWSPDGKKLAFSRGGQIWILNLGTGKEWLVTRIGKRGRGGDDEKVYIDWDPIQPVILCATGESKTIRMVDYLLMKRDELFAGRLSVPTYAPTWSPSGKLLALVRAGDVWVAERSPDWNKAEPGAPAHWVNPAAYYGFARRLAPLAVFNDAEVGISDTTPYWVDELAWTRDEKRLVFHFQRRGGSGVSQIGYLDLSPIAKTEDKQDDWSTWSGFTYTVHWILDDVFSPRICPDGKTLSYTGFDERRIPILYITEWNGLGERELFPDVGHPDWRPR